MRRYKVLLANFKTRFDPTLSTYEKCLHQVRNMTVVIYSFDVFLAFEIVM